MLGHNVIGEEAAVDGGKQVEPGIPGDGFGSMASQGARVAASTFS